MHDKEISVTASGPHEKGDGQIFQVSSESIYKMTRISSTMVWYSPKLKAVLRNLSYPIYREVYIFVLSFASAVGKIGERNACLQRLPLMRRSVNQTTRNFVAIWRLFQDDRSFYVRSTHVKKETSCNNVVIISLLLFNMEEKYRE